MGAIHPQPTLVSRLSVAAVVLVVYSATAYFLEPLGGWQRAILLVVVIACGLVLGWFATVLAALAWLPFAYFGSSLGGPPGIGAFAYASVMPLLVAATLAWLLQMREALLAQRESLAESESRFRQLTQASFEGLVIVDQDRIVEVNDAFAKLFGRTRAELVGTALARLSPAEDRELLRAALATQPEAQAGRGQRADGSLFEMEVSSRPLRYQGRELRVAAVRDITLRKREEEVGRRNERLAALGTLVAGVAHEINNPLAYVRGNVEIIEMTAEDLLRGGGCVPSVREAATTTAKSAHVALQGLERIAAIVRALRLLGRPPARERTVVDPNAIIREVANVAGARAKPGIEIRVEERATGTILAHDGGISQVVLNLALNALEAVAEKGSWISLRTLDVGEAVVIEVEDDGPGIPANLRAMLFTPFFTTKARGTGLGLSVSHAIAEDHGGRVTFETDEGKGSTFRLSLPAHAAPTRPLQVIA